MVPPCAVIKLRYRAAGLRLAVKITSSFLRTRRVRAMSSDNFWATKFAGLRYAIAWLGYACMRLTVLLPFKVQLFVGRVLGRLAYALLPKRRRIAARNIEACLRDLTAD